MLGFASAECLEYQFFAVQHVEVDGRVGRPGLAGSVSRPAAAAAARGTLWLNAARSRVTILFWVENRHACIRDRVRYILPTPTPVIHYLRISSRLFALVPAAVAINLVVGTIVRELSLPVYLDTWGPC